MSVKVPETAALPLTPEQERVRAAKEEWRQKAAAAFAKTPAWRRDFTTVSSADCVQVNDDIDMNEPSSCARFAGAYGAIFASTRQVAPFESADQLPFQVVLSTPTSSRVQT